MRSLGVLAPAVVLVAACSTSATGPSGNGGAAPLTAGLSGGSTTTTTTGPAYTYDGGPSTLPVIPETCTADDAGCAGGEGVEYQCPTDMDASADASIPANCPSDPQNGTGPALYCCSNLCASGCGDLPCPTEACPATATLLLTCGPSLPDLEPGCTLIATRPSPQGLGQRFSFCCASL